MNRVASPKENEGVDLVRLTVTGSREGGMRGGEQNRRIYERRLVEGWENRRRRRGRKGGWMRRTRSLARLVVLWLH